MIATIALARPGAFRAGHGATLTFCERGHQRSGCIAKGDRADAHRQMMRRLGIRREHIRYQASPAGDVMVLVWEGVEQDRVAEPLGDLVQNPQSEHERYIATYVIPDLHGVDPSAGPPPVMAKVATIDS